MSKQFHDSIELKGKHATVMRDGIYLYMPSEIGINDGRDPNTPVQVLRPATEVEKAYNKFKELVKLPITIRHPDTFVDHADENVWKNGEASNPELRRMGVVTTIDCLVDIKNQGIKDYEAGTKELSCGWTGDFMKADNGPCEFIQVFHDINHIAIVPAGRCGPMCRINDAIIDGGKKTMTVLDKILSFLKLSKINISDEQKELLKALTDEETKKEPDKTEDKKKKKSKDEDGEKEENEDEEGEEEEEDCNKDKKKKNKDKAVFDKAIKDAYEKGQKELKEKFLAGMNDVMPIMSEFKASEITDKTPCEIKAMFIKKITDEDIKDSDPALNSVFKMVMKNYEHPAYRQSFKTEVNDDKKVNDEASEISSLTFNKDAEVK